MTQQTKTVKIKDLGEVVTGTTPSTRQSKYYGPEFLFIKPSDINPGIRRVTSTETMLSKEGHESQRSRILPRNTTCVVCIGTIGKICLTNEPCSTNQQINSVISDQSRYDPLYVYYLLCTAIPKVKKVEGGSASGREHVNKSVFSQIEVDVHPLPTQRKIAAVLSAYDDLIENNTRRIAILEEMAQALYREWFVHFRFPGHETVKMVESELGPVPEGWEIDTLEDHITVDKGLSYKGKFLTDDGIPMVNLKNISVGGGFKREATKPYSGDYKSRHVIRPGDLIFANTDLTQAGNVIGSPAILPPVATEGAIIFSHHLYAIRFREETQLSKHFLYHILLDHNFKSYAKGHASGTTVLGLRANSVLAFPFIKPPRPLLDEFEKIIIPIYELMESCEQKNTTLRRTRNLLLPRLISGEVDVSELEITMEE